MHPFGNLLFKMSNFFEFFFDLHLDTLYSLNKFCEKKYF
jgi:hypothetical protein